MQGNGRHENIICRQYLRQRCLRGKACNFNHPEYILSPDSPSMTWLDFCKDFQRGRCFLQDCRYFHVTQDEEDLYRQQNEIAPSLLEQAMRKALTLEIALTGTRATCKNFLQGGCSLPLCPYRHITRHEFANEVLNTLRSEFDIVLGLPDSYSAMQPMPVPNIMRPGMGQVGMPPMNKMNGEDPAERLLRLKQENEEIFMVLDPDQKANSLDEIRSRLLTLQAALQWKDGNDTAKGGFIEDTLPIGMAVVNYSHVNNAMEEPNINFMRRGDAMPMQSKRSDQSVQSCKLFIGGLHHTTETEDLRDYFSRFGDIVDCVVINKKGNKSRGFGFVTYAERFMAQDCIRSGPHSVDGKVVDVKLASPREESDRDRSPPRSSRNARSPDRGDSSRPKLFVGGLSSNITTDVLLSHFGRYGNIIDAVSMQDPATKNPRSFGFVEFEEDQSAVRALADIPHKILGTAVTVNRSLPKTGDKRDDQSRGRDRDRERGRDDGGRSVRDSCKMFVGGLNFATKDHTLRNYFGEYGTVTEVKVHRGFGFVHFKESYMVEDAIDGGPHEIDGRRVDVGHASVRDNSNKDADRTDRDRRPERERPRERQRSPDYSEDKQQPQNNDDCRLFIGKIPQNLEEDDIERYFSQYGNIVKMFMKVRKTFEGSFCFVTFEEPDMVELALDDGPHEINGAFVEVGRPQKREKEGRDGGKNQRTDDVRKRKQPSGSDLTEQKSKSEEPDDCKLYVGRIPKEMQKEELEEYFSQYGAIVRAEMKANRRGGVFAFIIYESPEMVDMALDEAPHEIDGNTIDVGRAVDKDKDDRGSRENGGSRNSRFSSDDRDRMKDRRRNDQGSFQPDRRTADKIRAEKRSHLD